MNLQSVLHNLNITQQRETLESNQPLIVIKKGKLLRERKQTLRRCLADGNDKVWCEGHRKTAWQSDLENGETLGADAKSRCKQQLSATLRVWRQIL